jgi:hypothetical protein
MVRTSSTLSRALFAAAVLVGCGKDDTSVETSPPTTETASTTDLVDADGDGVTIADGDCNDADPAIHPGRLEDCDGVDQNCSGVADEGTSDADGDGQCDLLDVEECDGVDNDGDGRVDEVATDVDGDGVADCVDVEACDGEDNDGDGLVDEDFDADGDGFAPCGVGFDCDDGDAAVNPEAAEIDGDGGDNDCDGLVDEASWRAGDLVITELLIDPASVADARGEWFEVHNVSGRPVVLDGLRIEDDGIDAHVIAAGSGLSVDVDGRVVLAAAASSLENGGVAAAYGWETGLSLGNGGDTLRVVVPGGAVIDEVSWGSDFVMSGVAMALDPSGDAASNDDASAWCPAVSAWAGLGDLGSPGASNDPCATMDGDGDGWSVADGDCDDADPDRYPGAWEGTLGIDEDCDGMPEQAPDAVVAVDGAVDQCDVVVLDGRGSTDPQGSPLTWRWELIGVPAGSSETTADLSGATASVASFTPRHEGVYTVQLVVTDPGGAASLPAVATIETNERVANAAPVADAGASEVRAATVACTAGSWGEFPCLPCADAAVVLDGGASTDADGDTLSYRWEVLAGNGVLASASTASPTLTVAGPVPSAAGMAAEEVVYVALEVSDCLGATALLDVITVTYTCTGT